MFPAVPILGGVYNLGFSKIWSSKKTRLTPESKIQIKLDSVPELHSGSEGGCQNILIMNSFISLQDFSKKLQLYDDEHVS